MMAGSMMAAGAQQQQGPPEGWFKACTKQEEVDICNVQNIMVAGSGQLITAISLLTLEGQVNRRVFQVTVPSGRAIPPGIGMQVDGGQTQQLEYVICMPDRCIAEAPLDDNLVNSFKRGGNVTFTSVNFQNQQSPIQVSLEGFTAAYDGEPMQQSDLEARQRQLQDYVSRNTDDFARRLQEEQERAMETADD
jgi:invasion protein IalB